MKKIKTDQIWQDRERQITVLVINVTDKIVCFELVWKNIDSTSVWNVGEEKSLPLNTFFNWYIFIK